MDLAEGELPAALLERARVCRSAGFELDEAGAGVFRLEVAGPLPPAWCGHLFAQCAAAGLSVLDGQARRVAPGRWAGAFRVVPIAPGVNVRGFDFAHMARRPTRRWARPDALPLGRTVLARDPAEDGALRVDVEGDDQVGFLASLIERFALFGLYPVRLAVATRDGRVCDRFWLTGAGGTGASEEAERALAETLAPLRAGPWR